METPTAKIRIAFVILINTGCKCKEVIPSKGNQFFVSPISVEFCKLSFFLFTSSRPIIVSFILWDLSFNSFVSSVISWAKKSIYHL